MQSRTELLYLNAPHVLLRWLVEQLVVKYLLVSFVCCLLFGTVYNHSGSKNGECCAYAAIGWRRFNISVIQSI